MKKALYIISLFPCVYCILFLMSPYLKLSNATFILIMVPGLIIWFLVWLGFLIYAILKEKVSGKGALIAVFLVAFSLVLDFMVINVIPW